MKKVLQFINKKKKLSVVSSDIVPDAVPEAPRHLSRYILKQHEFDSNFGAEDCCTRPETVSNQIGSKVNNSESEVVEVGSQINGSQESSTDASVTNIERVITSDEVEEITETLKRSLVNVIQELPVVSPASEPLTSIEPDIVNSSTSDCSGEDATDVVSQSNSSNHVVVPEMNGTLTGLHNGLTPGRMDGDKKNEKNGNTYVITISNSAHFHIGSQKTINYPGVEDSNLKKREPQLTGLTPGKILPLKGNEDVDIKEKLSEDDLLQISLNIHDKWREFARNLGVEESTIQELEELNDNYNFTVYDILQLYLSRYPDTSVGYMINVLTKSNEVEAARKLIESKRNKKIDDLAEVLHLCY